MLPLGLFRRRNFAIGNFETFVMYGGLGVLFFLLVLFLQQVAGYSALEAGTASLPVTLVMFAALHALRRCSPTATARASSWASARSSRPRGWRSSCAWTRTWTT